MNCAVEVEPVRVGVDLDGDALGANHKAEIGDIAVIAFRQILVCTLMHIDARGDFLHVERGMRHARQAQGGNPAKQGQQSQGVLLFDIIVGGYLRKALVYNKCVGSAIMGCPRRIFNASAQWLN